MTILPEVWQRWKAYESMAKGEVSVLGLVRNDVSKEMVVYDIIMPKQENTSVASDMDDADIARIDRELREKGQAEHLRCWIHSHDTMDVFWSGKDLANMERMIASSEAFLISIVTNKANKYHARLDVYRPYPLNVDGIKVVVPMPEVAMDLDALRKEMEEKCGGPGRWTRSKHTNASDDDRFSRQNDDSWEYARDYYRWRDNDSTRNHSNTLEMFPVRRIMKEEPEKSIDLSLPWEKKENAEVDLETLKGLFDEWNNRKIKIFGKTKWQSKEREEAEYELAVVKRNTLLSYGITIDLRNTKSRSDYNSTVLGFTYKQAKKQLKEQKKRTEPDRAPVPGCVLREKAPNELDLTGEQKEEKKKVTAEDEITAYEEECLEEWRTGILEANRELDLLGVNEAGFWDGVMNDVPLFEEFVSIISDKLSVLDEMGYDVVYEPNEPLLSFYRRVAFVGDEIFDETDSVAS